MPGPAMAYGPGGIYWWSGLMGDADFQRLSPQSQAVLRRYFEQSREPGEAAKKMQAGLQSDPQLQAAVQEARSAGALDHPEGGLQQFIKYAGLAAVGGAVLPAVLGGGAAASAAPAGAGAAPIAAPAAGGVLPATVLGNGAAGTVAGGAGIGGVSAAGGGVLDTLRRVGGNVLNNGAGDLGNVLTGAAAGAAYGRRADADMNQRAAVFNRDLPAVRAGQVARGEVLNTMQDAKPTGDPRIDKFAGGGLRPSAFGPQSRQAGAELSRQAMSGLMNPEQDRIKPSQAGIGENLAAGAGLGLSIFDLLRKYGGR